MDPRTRRPVSRPPSQRPRRRPARSEATEHLERTTIPAPRSGSHDRYDDVDEPSARHRTPRRTRRWVPVAGVVGIVVTAAFAAGSVALVVRSAPARHDTKPVAFDPPVQVGADSEYVQTRVLTSGAVQVDHWIRSDTLLSQLTLDVPSVRGVDTTRVRVGGLTIDADGRRLGRSLQLYATGRTFFFVGSTTVHVRYVLRGVSQRTGPGRRTVRLPMIRLSYRPSTAHRTLAIVGARVVSTTCTPEQSTPAPCGRQARGRWIVPLDGDRRTGQVSTVVETPSA